MAFPEAAMSVRVDGAARRAGSRSSRRTGWSDVVLRVPADRIAGDAHALEISGRYAAFRYWFYQ